MTIRLSKLFFMLCLAATVDWNLTSFGETPQIMWQPNGILVNDTIGASNQKNPKVTGMGGGSSMMIWVDERNGYTDIYGQKISASGTGIWGTEGIPICNEPKNQTAPQIISDGAGGAIVVWEDYRRGEADIYAQKIDSLGRPMWKPGGVAICVAEGAQLAPKLAPDGVGGAIIAWYDYRSRRGEDIYAQRIDASGGVKWKSDGVAVSTAPGTQWYPEIITDSSGGAIIAWTDFRSSKGSDIYAQHLDMNGNILWQVDGLPVSAATDNQAYPKIAVDGAGGAIIVWDDFRGANFDIYAQRVDASGKGLWRSDGLPVANTALNEERPETAYIPGDGAIICWLSRRGDRSDLISQKISLTGDSLWTTTGLPVSKAAGDKENYKISNSADGGVVIAWEDSRNGPKAIYAQKISGSGATVWESDGVQVCSESEDSELPDIAQIEGGKTVIVWQDRRHGDLDIFAQSVSSNGSKDWDSNGAVVNSSLGSVNQQNPKIAYDGEGNHIIVWEDARAGYLDIYAQKVNEAGQILWGASGIPIVTSPGVQKSPQIIYVGGGSMIIAWEDNRSGKSWDVYAQNISADGSPLWQKDGVLVAKSETSKSRLDIVPDGSGGMIAVWEEDRGASRQDVYAQKTGSGGRPLWGDEGIAVCKAPSDQTNPVIATDGAGGAIIAWVDYRNGSFNPDIYVQKINTGGATSWKDNGVPVCTAPDVQKSPAIVPDGSGGAIITWTDKGGGDYDIYAQIIDRGGNPTMASDGIPVCQAPGTQRDPKIAVSGNGEAIIVWNDFRNANWDIYAQKINSVGQLLWKKDGIAVCTAPQTQYSPELVAGTWGTVITWEDYRSSKNYNVYGQKLNVRGEAEWQTDGLAVASGPDGQRNPEIAENGGGGAVICWEDYRSGGFGIYAQKIKVTRLE